MPTPRPPRLSPFDACRTGFAAEPAATSASPRTRLVEGVVLLGCLALFTFGNHAMLWDRDEPRYASASSAMLASGDFVVPTHNGQWRLNKPVGVYWLQAASLALLGENEFAHRFPSALLLALTAWLLLRTMRRWTGRLRPGLLAVAAFAGCLMTQYQAHAATIDASLTFVTAAMMLVWFEALGRAQHAHSRRDRVANRWRWVAFYVLGALGVLLKMPVIVAVWAVSAGAYAVWSWPEMRRHRRLRPLSAWWPHVLGIAAGLAVTLPWLVAVSLQTDGAFLARFIGQDVMSRAAEPMDGHAGPVIYYVAVLLAFFYPWVWLLPLHARWLAEAAPRGTVRFLVCWGVAPVLMFSLMATKLPHYIFPCFPALALLTGFALDGAIRAQHRRGVVAAVPAAEMSRFERGLRYTALAVMGLVGVVAFAMPVAAWWVGLTALVAPASLVALGLGGGSLALVVYVRRRDPARVAVAATAMMLVVAVGLRLTMPAFDVYKRSTEIAAVLHPEGKLPAQQRLLAPRPTLYGFGYAEDSVSYYTRFAVQYEFSRDMSRLVELAAQAREQKEPVWVVIAFPTTPGAQPEGPPAARLAKWTPQARQVYEESRLLGRVGPIFHYNTSRDHWRMLEIRQLK